MSFPQFIENQKLSLQLLGRLDLIKVPRPLFGNFMLRALMLFTYVTISQWSKCYMIILLSQNTYLKMVENSFCILHNANELLLSSRTQTLELA